MPPGPDFQRTLIAQARAHVAVEHSHVRERQVHVQLRCGVRACEQFSGVLADLLEQMLVQLALQRENALLCVQDQ